MRRCFSWVLYAVPILSVVYACLVLVYYPRPTQYRDDVQLILSKAPSILRSQTYRCRDMVEVVNHLRRLGKDKALTVLREYLEISGEDDRVLVICRLLFVNPKGWNPPGLGEPSPPINWKVAKEFPLFPIALSDRVPFLLVGYQLGGMPEWAGRCLKLCEGLSLVEHDYPLSGYEKAARALIQTAAFRQLYQKYSPEILEERILAQATKPAANR